MKPAIRGMVVCFVCLATTPGYGGKQKFTRNENGLHISLSEKFNGKTALTLRFVPDVTLFETSPLRKN